MEYCIPGVDTVAVEYGWNCRMIQHWPQWSRIFEMKTSLFVCHVRKWRMTKIKDQFHSAELLPIPKHLRTLEYYSRPNYSLVFECLDKIMKKCNVRWKRKIKDHSHLKVTFLDSYEWETKTQAATYVRDERSKINAEGIFVEICNTERISGLSGSGTIYGRGSDWNKWRAKWKQKYSRINWRRWRYYQGTVDWEMR